MELIRILENFGGAHDGMLSCGAICNKQKKLLITGGGDATVNIWLLSKTQPISVSIIYLVLK